LRNIFGAFRRWPKTCRTLLQYGQVELAVAVFEEDGLPVVAPLRDVMRHPDCHGARHSSHHNKSGLSAEFGSGNFAKG
jgi:hypothetical protein